jgi:hypothetical protein
MSSTHPKSAHLLASACPGFCAVFWTLDLFGGDTVTLQGQIDVVQAVDDVSGRREPGRRPRDRSGSSHPRPVVRRPLRASALRGRSRPSSNTPCQACDVRQEWPSREHFSRFVPPPSARPVTRSPRPSAQIRAVVRSGIRRWNRSNDRSAIDRWFRVRTAPRAGAIGGVAEREDLSGCENSRGADREG